MADWVVTLAHLVNQRARLQGRLIDLQDSVHWIISKLLTVFFFNLPRMGRFSLKKSCQSSFPPFPHFMGIGMHNQWNGNEFFFENWGNTERKSYVFLKNQKEWERSRNEIWLYVGEIGKKGECAFIDFLQPWLQRLNKRAIY